MTSDEARRLLAGYATGSLSPSERKALFDAALEHQELFDELADEHALKEVLDQPGARERLIAALEPSSSRAAWWMRPWPWAAAAAMLAIAIGVTMLVRTKPLPKPQQVAQVMKSPEAPVPQAVPPAPVPSAPAPRKAGKSSSSSSSAAPSVPEARNEPAADRLAPAAAPRAENVTAASAVAGFGLDYAVQPDGFLQIVPDAPGYLSIAAGDSVIFPSTVVRPRTPVRVAIPAEATTLTVNFSANPSAGGAPARLDATSGTVSDQDPPNQRISIQIPAKP